jgi:rhodanese-related sulfurtransferase/DNA-binding transcriptional ArsR family regulator
MLEKPRVPPKQALYEQLARVGKAVAAPRRLELLDLLSQAPRTVEGLAEQTGMSVANTSQHLLVLRAAGLVESEKARTFVTYRLASDAVADFFVGLRTLAETSLAEASLLKKRFFASDEDVDEVDGKALLALVRRRHVVLLDVRPAEEFAVGHIAAAISIPHDELKRRLAELPKNRKIVAYCRGPYCLFAVEAVKLLRARGFAASRIEDGVPDWRARGLPVARTGIEKAGATRRRRAGPR